MPIIRDHPGKIDMNRLKGRAAGFNPANRFEHSYREPIIVDIQYDEELPPVPTTFFPDSSRSILAKNDSPDLPFRYSINPYRGCEHGCIYCYARPSHEYLGFSAGIDFETKIMVKQDAATLLGKALEHPKWTPQMVAFSGNTDCYQPAEREFRLTRHCLEVFLEYRNPVGLITKNALVLRDIDILKEMASMNLVHVMLSITTLNPELARTMEPRTSSPQKRLAAIGALAKEGVPVGVNVAPIIPGLTDEEIPAILSAAAEAGAQSAGYILLRLPGAVEPLFIDWIRQTLPERAAKVIGRIKETRAGKMSETGFRNRMTGSGPVADTIQHLFGLHVRKFHLDKRWSGLSVDRFRRIRSGQLTLF